MDRLQVASRNGKSPEAVLLDSLSAIEGLLRQFREERGWERFHSPKNLGISLAIEVGELLEHFQWRSDKDVMQHIAAERSRIAEEVADVVIYAIQLADVAKIDLGTAIADKISKNSQKYPRQQQQDVAGSAVGR
jgi:NTP pyrophosphatase (non-canonical NTP hydrolase)